MAAVLERPKRCNAGSRMAKLLQDAEQEEEDDEFYKTTYGGFEEEECDNDYESEEGGEDSFDSDFSLSENDDDNDVEDDGEDEDKKEKDKKKKKIKFFTPKATKTSQLKKKVSIADAKPKVKKAPAVKKVIPPLIPMDKQDKQQRMRATTVLKASQVVSRAPPKPSQIRRHPSIPQMRRLTQGELLAEAEITEEKNLASLAQLLKFEEDKKNAKVTKSRFQGPVIKFQSVRMPQFGPDGQQVGYCSRSFLEFTDTKSFPQEYFPPKVKHPKKPVCAVTGLPAKYKDPLTGLPYATIEAFKYIRQHRKRLREQLVAKHEIKKRKKIVLVIVSGSNV